MLSRFRVWLHKRNLQHPQATKVCGAVAGLLAVKNDDQVVGLLSDQLGHDDSKVRTAIARGLGNYGDRKALNSLIQAMLDKSAEVRSAAAGALGKLGDKQAIPVLIKALGDIEPDVRRTVGNALTLLGEPTWHTCVKGTDEDFTRLGACGDKRAVTALIAAAKNPKSQLRLAAISGLGKLGDRQAYLQVFQAIEDPHELVRMAAIESLALLKDPLAVEPLVRLLKHREPETRAAAARALGQLKDVRAVGPLHKSLEDPDETVCEAAVEALCNFGHTDAASLRSRDGKQEVFAGKLGVLDVAKIMCMVEPLKLTGALRVADGRTRIGHIHFVDGAVRHADLHDAQGPDALFQLFHFTSGAFRFDLTPPTDKHTIEGNTMMLLLEGMRKLDEAQKRIEARKSSASLAKTTI